MSFRQFESAFRGQPVIDLPEIRLRFPQMHRRRLNEWQEKGYLLKIRNGYYRLAERPINEHERWAIANRIFRPSYVSLRSAFAYYGLIPEGVFHVESLSPLVTKQFNFEGVEYSYRSIKPSFYYGYRFIEFNDIRVLLASPEKALLDLLYLHPEVKETVDFESWRFDADEILRLIDPVRMDDLALAAGSKALMQRYTTFKNWLNDRS